MGSEFPRCVACAKACNSWLMLRNSRLRCLVCLGAERSFRGQTSRTLRQSVDSPIEALRFLREAAPGEIERDEFGPMVLDY